MRRTMLIPLFPERRKRAVGHDTSGVSAEGGTT
jgi:hypothetical protein